MMWNTIETLQTKNDTIVIALNSAGIVMAGRIMHDGHEYVCCCGMTGYSLPGIVYWLPYPHHLVDRSDRAKIV